MLLKSVLLVMAEQDQLKCYPYLRKRGQVTIPEEVRTALEIEEGDQIELTIEKV